MQHNRFNLLIVVGSAIAWLGGFSASWAANFELFEFNDGNTTQLADAMNSANAGNNWVVDPQMAPSQVQNSLGGRPSSYYIIKSSTASDNNFLQLADISNGTRYLTTKIAGWNFQETSNEQFRLAFINSDTAPNFGNLITAQVSLVRGTDGTVELTGGALGPGSSPVMSSVFFPAEHDSPFELTLELNKTAHTYKVFYRDGTNPTQVLGAGTIDPTREGKALRLQATGNFGDFAGTFPSDFIDFLAVDRIAMTDVNPHTDLITLEVDRDNGTMTLRNTSGSAVSGIESYSITSAAGGLNPVNWTPIGGGTNTSSNAELMQTFAGGISLTNGQAISLSNASGAWLKSPFEDLAMVLNLTGGATRTVNASYIDNGGLRWSTGDLNFDGNITAADYTLLVINAETSLTGLSRAEAYRKGDLGGDGFNSLLDFAQFKTIYDTANGAGSFAAMLASVPEPSSFILLGIAGATVANCRRRLASRHPARFTALTASALDSNDLSGDDIMPRARILLSVLLAIVALGFGGSESRAAILEDFTFSDANGTVLADTENSAHPDNNWVVTGTGTGELTNSSVLNGAFRIQKTTLQQASNYIDLANITSGKAWLVAETSGWSFTSTASSPSEEMRFAFLDNDNPPTFGSTITAQMRIVRAAGALSFVGTGALGTGASDVTGSFALPLARSTPFTMVLELDKDLDQYSVYYKDDTNPFQLLGTANLGASTINTGDRDGNSIRFAPTGSYNDVGEFFDVNRIYLTDTSPIGGPVTPVSLSLEVRSNGLVFIKNETAVPLSFDSYRIASASNALNFSAWTSLQDSGVDPFMGGNDPGELWTESGGSGDGVLAESFLLSASTLDPGESFPLGSAFKVGGAHDLTFQYRDSVSLALPSVTPTYVTVAGVLGDYNQNGIVDAADYTVWRNNLGSGTSLPNDDTAGVGADDYNRWKTNFGQTAGAGSSAFSSAAVPEPTNFALLLLAVMGWCFSPLRTP